MKKIIIQDKITKLYYNKNKEIIYNDKNFIKFLFIKNLKNTLFNRQSGKSQMRLNILKQICNSPYMLIDCRERIPKLSC